MNPLPSARETFNQPQVRTGATGSELFGPTSGDGFSELAQLDTNGNGWIDGADQAFSSLSIWTPGADKPVSISDAGIGTISLQNAATPFSIRDGVNSTLGSVRSTGVFLTDNGTAGVVQQIDVTY